jgi:hypothetical protein
MSTTLTRRQAAKQLDQEERQARQQEIDRRAARLEAQAAIERARTQTETKRARADAAEVEALEHAPLVTLSYGGVEVRIVLAARDEVYRATLLEAVRRTARAMGVAYRAFVGRVRAEAAEQREFSPEFEETNLMTRLRDELRQAAKSGMVEVVRS